MDQFGEPREGDKPDQPACLMILNEGFRCLLGSR